MKSIQPQYTQPLSRAANLYAPVIAARFPTEAKLANLGRALQADLKQWIAGNRDRNILGVCVGKKQTAGKQTGQEALIFLVRRKLAKKRLTAASCLPPSLRVRHLKQSFDTDVIEIGNAPRFQRANSSLNPGVATAHYKLGGGTLTAIVVAQGLANAPRRLLSCSHVFFPPDAVLGEAVESPPDDAGGSANNMVGSVTEAVPLKGSDNDMDAALATPSGAGHELSNQIEGVGILTSATTVDSPDLIDLRGGAIRGQGSVSAFTGKMVFHSTQIQVGGKVFNNVVLSRYDSLTENGDSGAPIFQETAPGQLELIGMHIGVFEHPENGRFGVMVPIARVFSHPQWNLKLAV